MCPELKEWSCGIAGIEPEKIECIDECCCYGNGWDKCRVYIAQFFVHEQCAEEQLVEASA
ncbi:MAG: hypothetical protein M1510_01785 [Nitrospirae bacterium]|nr:hypothetical protein [Nitrospirota bacterium]MCL5236929.1 hypothetical protein [Nitrospirota bacterium]